MVMSVVNVVQAVASGPLYVLEGVGLVGRGKDPAKLASAPSTIAKEGELEATTLLPGGSTSRGQQGGLPGTSDSPPSVQADERSPLLEREGGGGGTLMDAGADALIAGSAKEVTAEEGRRAEITHWSLWGSSGSEPSSGKDGTAVGGEDRKGLEAAASVSGNSASWLSWGAGGGEGTQQQPLAGVKDPNLSAGEGDTKATSASVANSASGRWLFWSTSTDVNATAGEGGERVENKPSSAKTDVVGGTPEGGTDDGTDVSEDGGQVLAVEGCEGEERGGTSGTKQGVEVSSCVGEREGRSDEGPAAVGEEGSCGNNRSLEVGEAVSTETSGNASEGGSGLIGGTGGEGREEKSGEKSGASGGEVESRGSGGGGWGLGYLVPPLLPTLLVFPAWTREAGGGGSAVIAASREAAGASNGGDVAQEEGGATWQQHELDELCAILCEPAPREYRFDWGGPFDCRGGGWGERGGEEALLFPGESTRGLRR